MIAQFLQNAAATLKQVLTDASGAALAATAVSVAIADSSGTAIAGSPFTASNPGNDGQTWEVSLPAQADLDTYTATWTATTTGGSEIRTSQFEIVGGLLFTQAELQAFDQALASVGFDDYVRRRIEVQTKFERTCWVSFVPRGRRLYLTGTDDYELVLPDLFPIELVSGQILTGDADGAPYALTAADIAAMTLAPEGRIAWSTQKWPAPPQRGERDNILLYYTYGFPAVPETIHDAALRYARYLQAGSNIPDRVLSLTDTEGSQRLAVPGRDGPTGLPEVDAVLADYDYVWRMAG